MAKLNQWFARVIIKDLADDFRKVGIAIFLAGILGALFLDDKISFLNGFGVTLVGFVIWAVGLKIGGDTDGR